MKLDSFLSFLRCKRGDNSVGKSISETGFHVSHFSRNARVAINWHWLILDVTANYAAFSSNVARYTFPTVLQELGRFLAVFFHRLSFSVRRRALMSQESASFTVKSAKRRGRLARFRQQTSQVVVIVVVAVVVPVSSRCHRFPSLPLSLSPSSRRSSCGAFSAKLKTFTSAKETRSRGRPSHKPGHISRGMETGRRETRKKLAKVERGWGLGASGNPSCPRLGCMVRAARGNKKKFRQDERESVEAGRLGGN